jgi:predicted secreted Zn-dependent protease
MPGRFLLLPVFAVIALWGCAGVAPTPAPQRERVMLKTSSSTRYYPVRGTTTLAIFDDIDRNGLFDSKAHRAVGLTSADWNVDWQGRETRPGVCGTTSVSITLNLVVTLPQHKRSSDLSPDVTASWARFAAGVAAHEQHHVDIYLDGARRVRTLMETILARPASCAALGSKIRSLWASQQSDIERAQDQFHIDDDARRLNDRKPLQAQIDINQARLSALSSEVKTLDQNLVVLKRRHDTTQAELNALQAEMGKSGASPPSCAQSVATRRIQALCQQYNGLIAGYNTLVEQHNGIVSRRGHLADEHDRIVATTNTLIEALNWTR